MILVIQNLCIWRLLVMSTILKYFKNNRKKINKGVSCYFPRIRCKDGFEMSVQASSSHYCKPRKDLEDYSYSQVEVGFLNKDEELLETYINDGTVFGYVPIEVVDKIIEKHGGLL